MTTYRMIMIGARGMYTVGNTASTPELARLATGSLIRDAHGGDKMLGIERSEWRVHARTGDLEVYLTVLVEAETAPGTWTIGPRA